MPGLEKNRIYRAHIDGYSSEGLGIARIDGQVVFVHGAIRGETCDVLVMKVLKNAAFGKIAALVEPSPARRTPDCPYYGRCGGCNFRHMSYDEELWAKRARVQDALTRIGGAEVTVEEILGAEQPLHYRNKSIYPISPAGEVGFTGPAATRWWMWSTVSSKAGGRCPGSGGAGLYRPVSGGAV